MTGCSAGRVDRLQTYDYNKTSGWTENPYKHCDRLVSQGFATENLIAGKVMSFLLRNAGHVQRSTAVEKLPLVPEAGLDQFRLICIQSLH